MNTEAATPTIYVRIVVLLIITMCASILSWSNISASTLSQEAPVSQESTVSQEATVSQESFNSPELITKSQESALTSRIYVPFFKSDRPCTQNSQSAELLAMIQTTPQQERITLQCDPILSQVAQAKAQDMAIKGYFDHVSPEGIGPNFLVRNANFPLSRSYSTSIDANNIESLAGGTTTPQQTYSLLIDSPSHRSHLLGETSFYRQQDHIGVGMVYDPDSYFRYYWVILIAKAETHP